MLKLNAGFSRKIGEPNYGSRGASVNIELEVESNLIGQSGQLLAKLARAVKKPNMVLIAFLM